MEEARPCRIGGALLLRLTEFLDYSGLENGKSVANALKTRAKKGRDLAIFAFAFPTSIFARFFHLADEQKSPCFTGFLHF